MKNKTKKILFSEEDIRNRIEKLGAELTQDYKDKNLLVVSLLRGSFIFCADLIRNMNLELEVDFLTTASYGHEEKSSGEVKIISDLRSQVEGRDVLIVDDIIDSGHTLKSVIEHINSKNPKSLKTCVLLDKPSRREVDVEADYTGFKIEDVFIVGYGLNYGDYMRNIPYIFTYEN